jgi:thiosulfate/3-mercaptopyruvate sulfurtransferase
MEYEQFVVETEWLADHLDDPQVRVFDCTVMLARPRPGQAQAPQTGGERYWAGHIPGAGFIDVAAALSEQAELRFAFPSAETVEATMSALGVDDETQVVLYDSQGTMWATRVWWILRAYGFDRAAILNGGSAKWLAEGRELISAPAELREGAFTAKLREGLVATRAEVEVAIADGGTCIIDALQKDQYEGEVSSYGRPGHIPSSTNVPFGATRDEKTGAFLPDAELRELFEQAGALGGGRVITYCGGGIAATLDAFLLTRMGVENVAVYDGSLSEWAADSSLPLVTGAAAGG